MARLPKVDEVPHSLTTLGLLGGTFDPIHNGHLRMALEFKQHLNLSEMRLLPCHQPPHRDRPRRSSQQRSAMAKLAVDECLSLNVDERELLRDQPSYTIETLEQLRAELGDKVSLCWCIGMDSLASLNTWHRWRDLLTVAHIVVAARPGWNVPGTGELAEWLAMHQGEADQLHYRSCGSVVLAQQSLLDISATNIRQMITLGYSPEFLMPNAVWRYIKDNNLYLSEETVY